MTDAIVTTWISLLDSAEVLRRNAPDREPGAWDRVGKAIDLLLAHEHIMTSAQRELARRTVWLRDKPDEPLPEDRSRWGECHCRTCTLAKVRQGVLTS
jgi:hypothetical protein